MLCSKVELKSGKRPPTQRASDSDWTFGVVAVLRSGWYMSSIPLRFCVSRIGAQRIIIVCTGKYYNPTCTFTARITSTSITLNTVS